VTQLEASLDDAAIDGTHAYHGMFEMVMQVDM